MRAAVLEKPYTFAVREMDMPVPGPGAVLVRVASTGICGSELHAYHGRHQARVPPVVLGHEVAGRVEQVGEGVTCLAAGSRVTVLPQRSCGRCPGCRQGLPNLCDARIMLGTQGWPGSFAEYLVAPAPLVVPLPDALSDDAGTLIEPLAVGVHAARRAGVRLGERVLVLGSGAIGLSAVMAARAAGADLVIATDVRDYNLKKAQSVGATHTANVRSEDVVALARSLTDGLGVDRAMVAVDAPGVLEQAIGATRKRGTIGLIAMFTRPVTFNLQPARNGEQCLVGCTTYDEEEFASALGMAARQPAGVSALVTRQFDLGEVARAFEMVMSGAEDVVRFVLHP